MFCLQVLFMLKDKRNRFTLRGKFLSSKSSDLKLQSAPLTIPRLNLVPSSMWSSEAVYAPPNRIAGRSELKSQIDIVRLPCK